MSDPPSPHRRPARLYREGDEPDPRFSLANERTALAWLRTALGLVAAGVGLTSLAELGGLDRWLNLVAAASCLLGGLLALQALWGWVRAERALRLGGPLPPPYGLLVLGVVVGALALALGVYALVELGR